MAHGQEGQKVELTALEERRIEQELTLNGTVQAVKVSELSAAVFCLVEKVAVEVGNRVESGDLLVALDDEIASHELASARAELQEAEAAGLAVCCCCGRGCECADPGHRKSAPVNGVCAEGASPTRLNACPVVAGVDGALI